MEMSDNSSVAGQEVAQEVEEQHDTYHDKDSMIRLAMNAGRMSGFFLVLFAAIGVLILVFIYWYFKGQLQLLQLIIYSLTAIVPFLLGGFFWIASRILSEWVYILMDIEDNTRPQKPLDQ
jgi:predicted RND superfamily exporter protein